jgi:sugar phosphate isomerase/epimerase
MIQDVGLDNVFVNLDLANLILYGKGNPVDAMDVIGHLVRGIHAKDGLFPTDPRHLGKEVSIGTGRVDFPGVFKELKRVNYSGPITIEREISGEQQTKDILQSKIFLQNLIDRTYN